MATLFHEGRKILRAEIKNNNYADIADFIYFRIQVSKYKDEYNNTFFLPVILSELIILYVFFFYT